MYISTIQTKITKIWPMPKTQCHRNCHMLSLAPDEGSRVMTEVLWRFRMTMKFSGLPDDACDSMIRIRMIPGHVMCRHSDS